MRHSSMIRMSCRFAGCEEKLIRGTPMQEFIARENIKRFEAQLADCTDPDRRNILMRLLDGERRLLADALAEKASRGETGS